MVWQRSPPAERHEWAPLLVKRRTAGREVEAIDEGQSDGSDPT